MNVLVHTCWNCALQDLENYILELIPTLPQVCFNESSIVGIFIMHEYLMFYEFILLMWSTTKYAEKVCTRNDEMKLMSTHAFFIALCKAWACSYCLKCITHVESVNLYVLLWLAQSRNKLDQRHRPLQVQESSGSIMKENNNWKKIKIVVYDIPSGRL